MGMGEEERFYLEPKFPVKTFQSVELSLKRRFPLYASSYEFLLLKWVSTIEDFDPMNGFKVN